MKHLTPTALWKLFALVQIFIISGLMLENTPSLTRITTEETYASAFIAVSLVICFIVLLYSFIQRHVRKVFVLPSKFVSYVLGFSGILVGITAAIIANSASYSPVLVIGYLSYMILLILGAGEVEKERRELE